jgi:hypothetical protein
MFNEDSKVPAADQFLENIISVQETLQDNIHQAKEIQKKYFDNRNHKVPTYQAGDWVWLLQRNISTTHPSGKLDFERLGPFKVDLALRKDVYFLILPTSLSRVHPVFHTSLLLLFINPKTFPQRIGSKALWGPSTIEDKFWDAEEVEWIMGFCCMGPAAKKIFEYLVCWCGGSTADDSWELGWKFDLSVHPYLAQFLNTFGTDMLVVSPNQAIRIPLGTSKAILSTPATPV